MLESQGVELLMKDYENLPGGQIRLPQCTMLFTENREGGDLTDGRIIVLCVDEGAILQFDSELNLRCGKVGKPIGGRLNGQVTIDGTPSKSGADDALFVAAGVMCNWMSKKSGRIVMSIFVTDPMKGMDASW